MNWTSIITVTCVWILILFLGISYFTIFLPSLFSQNKAWFYIITPTLCICIFIGCLSYLKAIIIAPGYPEHNLKQIYSDKIEEMQDRAQQQKQFKRLRKQRKLIRVDKQREIKNLIYDSYCEKCDNVKLSRVHHCKQCQRCIIRMDHHCPWVGNCVGKYNHKYFLLFLFYITISLLIVSISILIEYISGQVILNSIFQKDQLYYYITLTVGVMCLLLTFSLGFLLITQVIMLCQNITTLESFYDGMFDHNPFDTNSIIRNIKEIMGQSFWLLPTRPFPQVKQQKNVAF